MKNLIIAETNEPLRLDVYLALSTDYTRSFITKLNKNGGIFVNGEKVKSGKTIVNGDLIELEIPDPIEEIVPENIPLDIVYEDDDVAVINKQRGLVVHPAAGNFSGTLVNALMYHLKGLSAIGGVIRPGIVHRLDKNTTGLMVVAKNDAAHLGLSRQIADRKVKKTYRAIVEGTFEPSEGTIDAPIGRDPKNRKLMAVVFSGRPSLTGYKTLEKFEKNSYVEFYLHTGRTHQIRVHCKYKGHPVVGDAEYGFFKQRFKTDGQMLHSYYLGFSHPRTGKFLEFCAEEPEDFKKILGILKNEKRGYDR